MLIVVRKESFRVELWIFLSDWSTAETCFIDYFVYAMLGDPKYASKKVLYVCDKSWMIQILFGSLKA